MTGVLSPALDTQRHPAGTSIPISLQSQLKRRRMVVFLSNIDKKAAAYCGEVVRWFHDRCVTRVAVGRFWIDWRR